MSRVGIVDPSGTRMVRICFGLMTKMRRLKEKRARRIPRRAPYRPMDQISLYTGSGLAGHHETVEELPDPIPLASTVVWMPCDSNLKRCWRLKVRAVPAVAGLQGVRRACPESRARSPAFSAGGGSQPAVTGSTAYPKPRTERMMRGWAASSPSLRRRRTM